MEIQSPFFQKDTKEEFLSTIDQQGRKYKWVADQLGITKGHFNNIFRNNATLTEENRRKLNEILGTNI